MYGKSHGKGEEHIENPVFDHYRDKLRHAVLRGRVYRVGGGGTGAPIRGKDAYL